MPYKFESEKNRADNSGCYKPECKHDEILKSDGSCQKCAANEVPDTYQIYCFIKPCND